MDAFFVKHYQMSIKKFDHFLPVLFHNRARSEIILYHLADIVFLNKITLTCCFILTCVILLLHGKFNRR